MDENVVTILQTVVIQFPLLVLFIFYNERKDKMFQSIQREERLAYCEALEKLLVALEAHDHRLIEHIEDTKLARSYRDREKKTEA